ncbi:hypothetical protein FB451DRAFT_1218332 [Mycena latifolia]|nr:hypothetical protein FB451DRAFT_1218332 [Mycena latifolia]
MSLRTGLVRAARLSHISHSRFPPNLFVRASHDAYTSTRLEHFLHPLRYPDEPNAVRRHYLPLVAELERLKAEPSSPPLPPLLTREQLITIFELLATSGRPPDLECIRSMFSHLPVYFDIPVTPDLHTVVIAALLRQGYIPLAQQWITQIPELPPHDPPTLEHFHTFMKGCPHHVSLTFLRDVVTQRMRRAGVRPTNETFSILVLCIVRNAIEAKVNLLKPEVFGAIIADMKMQRLAGDPSILSVISEYYMDDGFKTYAEDMQKIYDAYFPDIPTPEEQQKHAWKKQLAEASQASGIDHSLDVFRGLVTEGCTATPDIIRAILSSSRSIEDLRQVEKALGIHAGVSEYAVLVNNNVRIKQAEDALAVYEEAKKSGVIPVAGLVAPIIRALCAKQNKSPAVHNANLDHALALYSDLDEAFPVAAADSPEAAANNHSEHSNGPDSDYFQLPSRGITATTAVKISKIILEMRTSETLDEAFNKYRRRRADLTEYGYSSVLHAFSRMSLSMGHPDSLEHYFQIVADMRLAGFRVSDRVYTDILQQFAEIANIRRNEWRKSKEFKRDPLHPMPPNIFGDLEAAVRQVHNLVSLDPNVAPERIVWNQLIDTYQRLGCFPDAYRVWEKLYLSGKYGAYCPDNYVFNLHNWNSYVECLCRLSKISDALKVICTDMGTLAQPVKPDLSTLTILLRFAESRIQTNIILQRARRYLPDLWEAFKDAMA